MVRGAKEAVMSYIKAMGDRDYVTARNYLGDNVRVKGPAGEVFRSPDEFLKMMEQQRGDYEIKKVFCRWHRRLLALRLRHTKGDYFLLFVVSGQGWEDMFDPNLL